MGKSISSINKFSWFISLMSFILLTLFEVTINKAGYTGNQSPVADNWKTNDQFDFDRLGAPESALAVHYADHTFNLISI